MTSTAGTYFFINSIWTLKHAKKKKKNWTKKRCFQQIKSVTLESNTSERASYPVKGAHFERCENWMMLLVREHMVCLSYTQPVSHMGEAVDHTDFSFSPLSPITVRQRSQSYTWAVSAAVVGRNLQRYVCPPGPLFYLRHRRRLSYALCTVSSLPTRVGVSVHVYQSGFC